jgi:hypothetical protein
MSYGDATVVRRSEAEEQIELLQRRPHGRTAR